MKIIASTTEYFVYQWKHLKQIFPTLSIIETFTFASFAETFENLLLHMSSEYGSSYVSPFMYNCMINFYYKKQ